MIDVCLQNNCYEIALAYPPCNEIGSQFVGDLKFVLDKINPQKANALILYSKLANGFSAGAHLNELQQALQSMSKEKAQQELKRFIHEVHALMNHLDQLPMVTIAVINGICFGGGFELALTCDLLIAEKNARFCFPELRLGLIPGFGGIPRLKRHCGLGVIQDLLFTGRSINAQKAAQLGLVSQVVAERNGLEIARNTARQINQFSLDVIAKTKAFIKKLPDEALRDEQSLFLKLAQQPVLIAALNKFVTDESVLPYQP